MAEQLPLFTSTPNLAQGSWRVYTLDTPPEEAAASFANRYGYPPQHVVEHAHHLWLGPAPEPLDCPPGVPGSAESDFTRKREVQHG